MLKKLSSWNVISIPDEMINVTFNRDFYSDKQKDIIKMINWCTKRGWKFGKEIGVISYDDTPLKEIISEGISVISNDFALMGKRAAEMILEKTKGRYSNEHYFIDRQSL
jgi:hypothetical protein